MDCHRWHRLGERCECGFIGTPARFYLKDYGGGETQEEAQGAYLKWAAENGVLISGLQHTIATQPPVQRGDATQCRTCGKENSGRGTECPTCRSRRSRLHTSV